MGTGRTVSLDTAQVSLTGTAAAVSFTGLAPRLRAASASMLGEDADLSQWLQPVPVGGVFENPDWCIWCGSAVRGDDGKPSHFVSVIADISHRKAAERDLQRFRITPEVTDVIEDAVAWAARQRGLAPDGKVGVLGISFSGGLAVVAAGRPSIRDKVAFVLSFGGHGDLVDLFGSACGEREIRHGGPPWVRALVTAGS